MATTRTQTSSYTKNLTLNLDDYPGGVAIWGALPALFDTSNQGFDRGVHVHARLADSSKKVIDATYDRVTVIAANRIFTITEEAAVHFSMSAIFDINIISLVCLHCSQPITSIGYAAVCPSRQHQCNHCGEITTTSTDCISNPIMLFKELIGDKQVKRPAVIPNRTIAIDPERYSGGIQIWGSNPSIIWTAKRLEESAIHIHAYNDNDKRVIDNTYGIVSLAGYKLDIEMIRVLQIQLALPNLALRLATVYCPHCGKEQFDQGIWAVSAHNHRICLQCKQTFISQDVISNPAFDVLTHVYGVISKCAH
ncbi:hypothetical protein [Legionella pneumophila]|uniref:Uncharacterized protein n=1 Tax=Legionella pneumophila subsp. pascullei TaxID=91890 RepID=A0AAX2J1E4_LEGPN|nr:hypothetical protein [Legionella pneumophila]AMP89027.1 hypothetical protein AXF35_04720 [Legionella pneumophila subsp. pascullei]AMP93305.1 hypothetical protein AXF36_12070 [Legionella pneumophila subsp. pascullei]AMP96271.1 hypothetical protein AXF37_11960 [Legionella pneumophila subsp. pascullei]SQG91234.1 Uncharacterised protein [Legionella pneumophila subsp. pascullei]VEH07780.1 Uncharacterised protein [Legionella pneumophila subsp. pascullei]